MGWDGTVIPEQAAYKSHRRAVLIKRKIQKKPPTLLCLPNQFAFWVIKPELPAVDVIFN